MTAQYPVFKCRIVNCTGRGKSYLCAIYYINLSSYISKEFLLILIVAAGSCFTLSYLKDPEDIISVCDLCDRDSYACTVICNCHGNRFTILIRSHNSFKYAFAVKFFNSKFKNFISSRGVAIYLFCSVELGLDIGVHALIYKVELTACTQFRVTGIYYPSAGCAACVYIGCIVGKQEHSACIAERYIGSAVKIPNDLSGYHVSMIVLIRGESLFKISPLCYGIIIALTVINIHSTDLDFLGRSEIEYNDLFGLFLDLYSVQSRNIACVLICVDIDGRIIRLHRCGVDVYSTFTYIRSKVCCFGSHIC